MKTELRWRFALCLFALVALVHPRAFAQQLTDPSDGGVSLSADASAPMLSVGGSDASMAPMTATPAQPASGSLESGPPAAALTQRPMPTAEQVQNLRTLEEEVDAFLARGRGFQQSVNGLLVRHRDRQLARLRQGYQRQIDAERQAEAEARRNAIRVFERFLETYPEDQERTPDVMFRLAELYFDEAAYAKLDADDRVDRLRAERQAQGLPSDDIAAPPVDYRCSVLLYRHIIARFSSFRLNDATHYLLGWVLKEMGHEDEALTAYKGMVCPSRFHYERENGFDLAAPLQPTDQPVSCGRLFDILRPRAPELVSPPPRPAPTVDADGGVVEAPPLPPPPPMGQTIPIPTDYANCQPLNGGNGQPSRYAGEVWYYVGDYHFDNARDDEGNAFAIAAYQAAMRASERRRAVVVTGRAPTAALAGADQSGIQQSAAARAQFDPEIEYGQFWSKALYKVGWAYFRMQNGYPQALRNFSFLLDYYDFVGGEVAAQGNRTDTIKWIGVIFSESDWGAGTGDEGQRCQPLVETVARPPSDAVRPFDCAGVIRIASPYDPGQLMSQPAGSTPPTPPAGQGFIPQDRPWTPEAYLELGNDYFQQTKYYEAIVLYRMFLQLYPMHYRAPQVAQNIAVAYERQRQYDLAIAARGRLANYVEGSQWYNQNSAHPDAQRDADSIARNSLHDTAIQYHQQASELRGQAAARRSSNPLEAVELLRRANEKYALAVQAYTQFIQSYPNDEAAYEFRYNRADALYWSRQYQEAARAYSDVRESNENDQFLAPAAYMAVKSQESAVRALAQSRQLDPCLAVRAGIPASDLVDEAGNALLTAEAAAGCTSAPAAGTSGPAAQQVVSLNIPEPVRLLMAARIAYSNRVPQALDDASALRDVAQVDSEHPENNPPYRPKFAYLNARTLMRFGNVQEAEQLYRQILEVYCQDPLVARATIEDINNLYVQMGRQDDLERFAEQQQQRQCASAAPGTAQASGFNPTTILQNRQMRLALAKFREAEQAPAGQSAALYEEARGLMEEAVRANRDHPQAALAMIYIAQAYERTGRFDSATQTYIRITQDFNSTRNAQGQELAGDDLQQRINILDESNFRAGQNLERIFDYDNAIRYYGNLVSDQRLATAEGHPARLHDALAAVAFITTNLGRWSQAADAWRNFIPVATAGRERAEAEYRAALVPFRAENWSDAIRSLQDYLRRVQGNGDNAQYRVQAQYSIAISQQRLGNNDAYRRALREVVTVYRASGQQPGSPAAAWAAEALFRDLDDQVTTFTRTTFTRGNGDALGAQLNRLKTQLRAIDEAATAVVQLRGGEYSIGAITRQGEAHEHLATQEQQIPNLIELSATQQRQLTTAERQITNLENTANRIENANADAAQRLRDQAQTLRDQLDQARQGMIDTVRQRFDEEAAAERTLAIINYGLAVYTARNNNIPTDFAATALERLRAEDNQQLAQAAFARPNLPFPYRSGMFDGEAPGAVASQSTAIATPSLVTE
ncbi:MAG: tetratricopeptide repeat protein [Polyangiales bacterium]